MTATTRFRTNSGWKPQSSRSEIVWIPRALVRSRALTHPCPERAPPSTDLGADAAAAGLRELREAVANAGDDLAPRPSLRDDALAGLSLAVANVPDGMADGVLGPASIRFTACTPPWWDRSWAVFCRALAHGDHDHSRGLAHGGQSLTQTGPVGTRQRAVRAGIPRRRVPDLFGVLGSARLTRFVSYSVTTGFLFGIRPVDREPDTDGGRIRG